MNKSKDIILDSVRRNRPSPVDLPELNFPWTTYPDTRAKFVEVLEAVSGTAIVAQDVADLNAQLQRLPHYSAAQRVVSLAPGVGSPKVDLATIESPNDLADVDVAILPGQFGVAENAAVWVTDQGLAHRALYFLCQHLVLVMPADAIVDNMHAAYERIASSTTDDRPALSDPMFGVFISGPSKTADIEQTLVVGAHGPKSITVCLLQN